MDRSNFYLDSNLIKTTQNKNELISRPIPEIVAKAILAGVPVPAFANAISYIDGLSTKVVGANLIQAQRDYFGAHTYKRIDREGSFHHQWQKHFDR
mgnify:CR=1 FL=1